MLARALVKITTLVEGFCDHFVFLHMVLAVDLGDLRAVVESWEGFFPPVLSLAVLVTGKPLVLMSIDE